MKKHLIPRIIYVFILLLITLACSISLDEKIEEDSEIEKLKMQLTLQALLMEQDASSNNNQGGQTLPQPAQQDNSSQTSPSTNNKAEEEEDDDDIPCNSSKFVSETISDFTVFKPGETFQKTWTLRNAGDCDWNEDYVFEFEEGNQLNGESSIKVNTVIEPNETITFKVNLKAPDKAGDYVGVWRLKADDGEKLGKYWVKIKVEQPAPAAPPFAVTSVSTNIESNYNVSCPVALDVEIYISVNGKGQIIYQPETSDLGKAPEDTINFNSAGTDTENYTWTIHTPGNYWLKVYVKDPNNQTFGPYNMNLTCTNK